VAQIEKVQDHQQQDKERTLEFKSSKQNQMTSKTRLEWECMIAHKHWLLNTGLQKNLQPLAKEVWKQAWTRYKKQKSQANLPYLHMFKWIVMEYRVVISLQKTEEWGRR